MHSVVMWAVRDVTPRLPAGRSEMLLPRAAVNHHSEQEQPRATSGPSRDARRWSLTELGLPPYHKGSK